MQRVVVVGGGIAGVSAAYFLADRHSVTVLEAEQVLAYHTTGRSAALFFETYGIGAIRSLTAASRSFFEHPPAGLTDAPLLARRGALNVARPDQRALLDEVVEEEVRGATDVRVLTAAEVLELVPVMRPGRLSGGLLEPGAADIDVAGLHQAFVRGLRRRGGEIRVGAAVTGLARVATGWKVTVAGLGEVEADVVVNAAGAWADRVAVLAGLEPLGLVPLRRTAFMVRGPDGSRGWPLVFNVAHEWYFKPDGIQLLCSPADETPSEPCDARHEEIDVAIAIERINADTILAIRSVASAWAGLRTFAPDREMVIGFDPDAPGFFWLAGQGGTGIQTAPGAGRLAASLISTGEAPDGLAQLGLEVSVAPGRFR